LVCDDAQIRAGRELLAKRGLPPEAVRFVRLPLNSMWVRDYGPLFVPHQDGSVCVAEGRYVQEDDVRGKRPHDDEVARLLGESLRLPVVSVPLQFEGGNLLSNGQGLCVSSVVLITENRQAGRGRAEIGKVLAEHFGFTSWAYVGRLVGEPSGHVDMFMTFLAPDVAVVGRYDPAVDAVNARVLDETAAILSGLRTARGPMKVYRIPMPPRRGEFWRTYTNVIFANGTLLVPTFKDVEPAIQEEALALYARLLPGWRVVGIHADSLEPSGGLLHCFSMHVPRYVSLWQPAPADDRPQAPPVDHATVPPRPRAAMGPAAVHLDRLGR
jgi:agmatine deiminase